MGVTYKLKQEVIDFIIQTKKADPSLSCRKLVGLIEKTLQIEVSKSSINAVIKEFALSNPIGRRSEAAPKNFFIPSEKKKELFAQVSSFLEGPPGNVEVVVAKEDITQEIMPPEEVPHLAPDVLSSTVATQVPVRDETWIPVDNMGIFLRWSLMQDLLRRPVLGHVLAKAAGMEESVAPALEVAIFLKAMGIGSLDALQATEMSAFWSMFDLDPRKSEDALIRFLGKNVNLSSLGVGVEAELGAAFVQGAAFRVMSDTGRQIWFSADLSLFIPGLGAGWPCPAFKAIEVAVDRFGAGKEPLVFDLAGDLDREARELLLFLDGRSKDRLDKIELRGFSGARIWDFTIKGRHRYDFLTGLWPDEALLGGIRFEEQDSAVVFREELTGEDLLIRDGVLVIDEAGALALRAIVVARAATQEKKVVLTNVLKRCMDGPGVLQKYLAKKGPLFNNIHNTHRNRFNSHDNVGIADIELNNSDGNNTLFMIFEKIHACFEQYADHMIFEDLMSQNVRTAILTLKGEKRHSNSGAHVRFQAEESFPYKDQLQAVVNYLNCCRITNYAGRKVFFAA